MPYTETQTLLKDQEIINEEVFTGGIGFENQYRERKGNFFKTLHNVMKDIVDDVSYGCKRDPAARNALEFVLLYPGFHAVILHRIAHLLWIHNLLFIARVISFFSRFLTGCDIVNILNFFIIGIKKIYIYIYFFLNIKIIENNNI